MKRRQGNMVGTAIIIVAVFTGGVTSSHAEETSLKPLKPQPILESALAGVNAAVAVQSGSNAGEISSKRTMGLVKIIGGSVLALMGVGNMVGGGWVATQEGGGGIGATAMVLGAGLGGGGAWLIYDGVKDRSEAAEMEANSSLNFAPTRGGGAVTFSRGW